MAPTPPIRLLVVEDQPQILRHQLKLLEGFSDLVLCGSARDGTEALRVLDEARPDVVLLDLGLPDLSGIEVTREILKRRPDTEVLIWTVFEEEDKVMGAIRAGAAGYLLKGTPAARLVEAIREVHSGGSIIQPQLARRLLRRFKPASAAEAPTETAPGTRGLSPREREILKLIARGLSNVDVARALSVSRATVRTHLEHIYQKLEVSNRTEAVTEGIRQGLIDV
ncbi:MAG: response regulator transcription factor [Deltaproteobacteria bacterium]|nr:response regulator transcription factor [Deltaproteobacteria bacterium]